MANPIVGYGYARIEQTTNPNSLIFSGVLVNFTGATTNLTINFTFTGVTGSFQSASFSLPVNESVAFAIPIGVPFSGQHAGWVTLLSGTTVVDTCQFCSDDASEDLGFQNVIIGHVMPDVSYPNLPSGKYPMAEEVA